MELKTWRDASHLDARSFDLQSICRRVIHKAVNKYSDSGIANPLPTAAPRKRYLFAELVVFAKPINGHARVKGGSLFISFLTGSMVGLSLVILSIERSYIVTPNRMASLRNFLYRG